MKKSRVIAYVDGFNLYFGLRSCNSPESYWLDVPKLLSRYLGNEQELVGTKYFTSRITRPPDKARRQTEYLEALSTLPNLSMYFGKYQSHVRWCNECGASWDHYSEKMTDVNIAVELLTDAIKGSFDIALLVSADSDLAAPIRALRELWPEKSIIVAFPPKRGSVVLQGLAHEKRQLTLRAALACQMPNEVIAADGYPRRRPPTWTKGSRLST